MRTWLRVLLLVGLVLGVVAPLAALSPAQVASPRPQGWVRDDAGMLSAEAAGNINARIDVARREHAVEFAVLIVADIGRQDPRGFATAVFNAWGIGDPQRHDGVLVFIAREQRAAEIVLGDGIDSDAQVAISERIMDGVLVPHLRGGDVAGGLLATVEALLRDIHGIAPPAVEVSRAAAAVESPIERASLAARAPKPISDGSRLQPATDMQARDDGRSLTPSLLFGGGAFALLGAFALRWWWRIRGRKCPRCSAKMQCLSEANDDAHLQPAQQIEERLGSVDYDVWACSACSFVDTRRHGAWFSRYARCSACNAVTLERSQTTLTQATYDFGGRVRVDEQCRHCNHRRQYERSTPPMTRPSSGSSGGRRSSGFSGGRSSGRGASGRW